MTERVDIAAAWEEHRRCYPDWHRSGGPSVCALCRALEELERYEACRSVVSG